MGRQRYIPIYVLFTFFTLFTMIFSGNTLAQEKPEFSNPDASDTHPYGVDYLIPEYFTGDKASILNKGLDSYNNRFIRPGNTNEGTTCWAYNSEDYENLYNQSMSRFGLTGGNEALFETQLLNQCIEDSKLIEYEVFIGPDYARSSDTYSYFKVKTSKLDSLVGTEREDEIFLSFNGWTTLGGYGHHNVDTRNQSSYIVAVRQVFTDNQAFRNTESSDDVFIYKNRYLEHTNLTDDLWHNDLPLASSGEHNRYRGYFHLYYGWDYEREGYLDGTLEGLDTETPYGTVLRLLAENDGVDVNVRYRTTEDNTYRHIPLHQDSLHYTHTNDGYYEGVHGNTITYEALNTESVREVLAQYYGNIDFTATDDSFSSVLPETPIYGWGKNFTYNDVGFSTQINLTELFNDFSETGVYKLYLVNRVNDMIVATELHVPQDVVMWANEHIETGALGFLGSAYGNQIEVDYGTLRGLNRTPSVGDVFNINTIQSADYGPSYFEIRYNNVSTLISQQDTRPIQHERGALLWFNPYHGEHGSDNEVTWNYNSIPSVTQANNEGYVIEHTGHSEVLIDAEGNRLSERYTLNTYGYWEDIHIESQDIGDVSMNDDFVWVPVSIDDSTNVSRLESIFEQDTHTLDDFPLSLTAQHVPNMGSGERVFTIEYLPFKEQGFRYTFVDADTGDVLYEAQDNHVRGGKLTDWLNGDVEVINLSDYVVSEDNAPVDNFFNISRFAEGHFEGVEVGYERVPNQTVDVYNWNTQTLEAVSLDDIVDEGVYYTMSTEQLKGITGSHVVTWDIEYQEMPEVIIHFEDEKGRTLREPLTTYASRYNTFGVLDIYEDNVWYNTDNIFIEGTQYERVSPELALDITEDTEITMTYKEVRSSLVTTNYTTMRATSSMNTTSTVLHLSVISYRVPYDSGYVNLDRVDSFSILNRVGPSNITYETTTAKRIPSNRTDAIPYERYFCTNGIANELRSAIQNLGVTNYNCDLTVIPPSSSINRFTHNGRPVDYLVIDRSQDKNYNYGATTISTSPSWTYIGTWIAEAGYNKKFKFRYIDSVTGRVLYESDEFYNYLDDMVTGKKNRMTQSEINHSLNLNYDRLRSTGIRNTFTHNGIDYTVVPNQRFDMYNANNDSDAPIVSRALQWLSGGGVSHNPLRPAFTHDNLDITWNILYEPESRRLGIRHSFNANQGVVPDGHNASNRILFPITYFDVPHGTRVNENTYCVNGIANHLYNQLRSYGAMMNDCLLQVVPRENMTHKYRKDGYPVDYAIRRLAWSGNNSAVTQDGHFFPTYYIGYNKKWNYRFIDSVTGAVLHESDYIGGYLEDMVNGKKSTLTQMEYDYSRSLPFRETNKLTDINNTYTHTNGINYTVVPNQSFDMYESGDENARIVSKRIQFLTNGRVSHAPLRPAFTPDNQNITWNILYEPEPRTVNFRPRIISTQNVVRVGHTRPNSEIKPIISFDVPYGSTINENTYCVDGTANHLRTTLNNMGAVTGDCHLTLISADAHGMYAYTLDGHPVKYAVRRQSEVITNYTSVGTRNMNFYVGYNKKFKYRYIDSVTGNVIYESEVIGNILEDLVNGRKEPLTANEFSYVRNLQHLQLPTDIRNTYTRNGVNYTAVPNQSFPVYENNNDNARIVNRNLTWYSNGNINPSSLRPAFTPDNLDITWNILFEPESRRLGIRHSFHTNEGVVPQGHTRGNRILFPITYFDVPHGTRVNENTYCVDGTANHLYSQLRGYGWVENDCLLRVVPRENMEFKYTQNGFPVDYAIRRIVWSSNNSAVQQDGHFFPNYYVGYNKKWNYRFIDSVTGAVLHESDYIGGYLEDVVNGKKSSLTLAEYDFSRYLPYRETNKLTNIRDTYTHTNGINYTVVPNQSFDMYASGDVDASVRSQRIEFLTNGLISHAPLRPAFTPDNLDITWNILYEPEPRTVNLRPRIISSQNVVRVGHTRPNSEIKPTISFDVPYGSTIDESTYCVDGTANHLRTTLNNMGAVTGDCHLTLISAEAHGMYAYTLDGHPVEYVVRRHSEVITNYTTVGTRNLNFYVGYNKKFKYRYIDSVTGEVLYESDVIGNILEDLVNGRRTPLTANEFSYVRNLQFSQIPTGITNSYTHNGVNYTVKPNQTFPMYEGDGLNARIINRGLDWLADGRVSHTPLRPAFTPDNLDITWDILFEPEERRFGIRHSIGPYEGAVPDGHNAGNRRLFEIDYFDVPHGTVVDENTYCVNGVANELYSKLRSYGAVMDDCLLTVVARDDMQLKYRIDGRPVEYAVRANEGSNISKQVLKDDFLFLNYYNGYNKKFKFRYIDSLSGEVIYESDEFYNYLDDMVTGKKTRLTQNEIDFSLNLNHGIVSGTGITDTFTHNGLEYSVVPNQTFDMYSASNDSGAPIVNRALQWLSNGSISHNPLRPAFTPDNLDITWNILYEPEPSPVRISPRLSNSGALVPVGHTHLHGQIKPTITFEVPRGTRLDENTYCVDGTANHLRTTLNNMGVVTGDCHLTLISADTHGMYNYTLDGHLVEYAVRRSALPLTNVSSAGTDINMYFYIGYNKKFKYRYIDSATGEVLYESEVIGNILEDLVNGRKTPLTSSEFNYSTVLSTRQLPTGITNTYTHNGKEYTVVPNQTFPMYENTFNPEIVNKNLEWLSNGEVSHTPLQPAFTPDNLDITWNILYEPVKHDVTLEFVNEEGTAIHQDVTFEVEHNTLLSLSNFCAVGTEYDYLKDLLPENIDGGYDFYCLYPPSYTIMAGGELYDNAPYGPYELISPSSVYDAAQWINSDTTITFVHREKPIDFKLNYIFTASVGTNVNEIQPVGHSNTWVRPSLTFPVRFDDVVKSDTFCVDGVANHLYDDVRSYGETVGDCHLDLTTPGTGLPYYVYQGNIVDYALSNGTPTSTSISQWYKDYGSFTPSLSSQFDIAYNKVFLYRYIDATTGEVLYESEVRGNVLEDYLSGKKATLTSSERRTATLLNFGRAVLRIEETLPANSTFNPSSVPYKIVPNQTVDVFTSLNVNDHTVGKTPIRAGELAQYGVAYSPDNEPVVWNILYEPEIHDVTLEFVNEEGTPIHHDVTFEVEHDTLLSLSDFCAVGTDYEYIKDLLPEGIDNGYDFYCLYPPSYTILAGGEAFNNTPYGPYELISPSSVYDAAQWINSDTTITLVHREKPIDFTFNYKFSSSYGMNNEDGIQPVGHSNTWVRPSQSFPVSYFDVVNSDTFCVDGVANHLYNDTQRYGKTIGDCHLDLITPETGLPQYVYQGNTIDYALSRFSPTSTSVSQWYEDRGRFAPFSTIFFGIAYNKVFQYRYIDATTGEVLYESEERGNVLEDYLSGKKATLTTLEQTRATRLNISTESLTIEETLPENSTYNPTSISYKIVPNQTVDVFASSSTGNLTTVETPLSEGRFATYRVAYTPDNEPVVWNILYEPVKHDVTLEFVDTDGNELRESLVLEVEHGYNFNSETFCLEDFPETKAFFEGFSKYETSDSPCIEDGTIIDVYSRPSPSTDYYHLYRLEHDVPNKVVTDNTTITYEFRQLTYPSSVEYRFDSFTSNKFRATTTGGEIGGQVIEKIGPIVRDDYWYSNHSKRYDKRTYVGEVESQFPDVLPSISTIVRSTNGTNSALFIVESENFLTPFYLDTFPETTPTVYSVEYALRISSGSFSMATPISLMETELNGQARLYAGFNNTFQYRMVSTNGTTEDILYESPIYGNYLENLISGAEPYNFAKLHANTSTNMVHDNVGIPETYTVTDINREDYGVTYRIVPNQTFEQYVNSPITANVQNSDLTMTNRPLEFDETGILNKVQPYHKPDNEPVVWNILYEPVKHDVTFQFVDESGDKIYNDVTFEVVHGTEFRLPNFCGVGSEYEYLKDELPYGIDGEYNSTCLESPKHRFISDPEVTGEEGRMYELVSPLINFNLQTITEDTTYVFTYAPQELTFTFYYDMGRLANDSHIPLNPIGHSDGWARPPITFPVNVNDVVSSDTFCVDGTANHLYDEVYRSGKILNDCRFHILTREGGLLPYEFKGELVEYAGAVYNFDVVNTITPRYRSSDGNYSTRLGYYPVYNKDFRYRFIDATTGAVLYESENLGNRLKEYIEGDVDSIEMYTIRDLNSGAPRIKFDEILDKNSTYNPTDVGYRIVPNQTFEVYATGYDDDAPIVEEPLDLRWNTSYRVAFRADNEPVVWNILYEPENHDVTLEFVDTDGNELRESLVLEVEHGYNFNSETFCLEDFPETKAFFEGFSKYETSDSPCIEDGTTIDVYSRTLESFDYYHLYRLEHDVPNKVVTDNTTITYEFRQLTYPTSVTYAFDGTTLNKFKAETARGEIRGQVLEKIGPIIRDDYTYNNSLKMYRKRTYVGEVESQFPDVLPSISTIIAPPSITRPTSFIVESENFLTPFYLDTFPETSPTVYSVDYALRTNSGFISAASPINHMESAINGKLILYAGFNNTFQYRVVSTNSTTENILYESPIYGNYLENLISGAESYSVPKIRTTQTTNMVHDNVGIPETYTVTDINREDYGVTYRIVPNQTFEQYVNSPITTNVQNSDLTMTNRPLEFDETGILNKVQPYHKPDNEPVVWNILYEPDSYYSGSTSDPIVHIAPNDVPDITLDDVEFDIEARDNEGIGWRLTDEEILARANVIIDEENLAGVRNAVITTRLTDNPSVITDSDTLTVFGNAHDGETESDLGTAYRYDNTRDKDDNLTYQLYISFDYTNAYITSGDETEVFWGEEYGDTVEVEIDDETEEIVSLGKMEIRIDLDVDPPYKSELVAPEIEDDAYVEHTHELLIGREITNLTFGIGEDYGEGQAVNGVVGERQGNTITRTYDDYTHYTVIEEPEDGIIRYHITTSHPSVTPYYETIEIMPTYLGTLETQGAVHINEYMSYASEHGNDLPDDYYAHYDIHYIDEHLMDVLDRTLEDKFRVGMLYDADTESFTLDRAFGLSTKYGIQVVTDATVPVIVDEDEDTESLEGIAADVDAIETELADALSVALNLTGLDATEDSLLEGLDYTVSRYFMPIDKDTYVLGMETTDSVEMSDLGLNDVYVNYDKTFTFEQYLMGNVNDDPVYAAQPSVPEQVEYQSTQRYQASEMEALIETITTRLEKYNLFRTIDDGVLLEHLEE